MIIESIGVNGRITRCMVKESLPGLMEKNI
jgi:hypothetical protein